MNPAAFQTVIGPPPRAERRSSDQSFDRHLARQALDDISFYVEAEMLSRSASWLGHTANTRQRPVSAPIARLVMWRRLRRWGAMILCGALLAGCEVELYANPDQTQADEIVATRLRHGIPAARQLGKGGSLTVTIDQLRFADAVRLLREQGPPKEDISNLADVAKIVSELRQCSASPPFVCDPAAHRARTKDFRRNDARRAVRPDSTYLATRKFEIPSLASCATSCSSQSI